MRIFNIFKKKNELEEYMEILEKDKSAGLPFRPPWMSMPKEQFEKAYKEYLKATDE